jgi:hypothetical protein
MDLHPPKSEFLRCIMRFAMRARSKLPQTKDNGPGRSDTGRGGIGRRSGLEKTVGRSESISEKSETEPPPALGYTVTLVAPKDAINVDPAQPIYRGSGLCGDATMLRDNLAGLIEPDAQQRGSS